MCVVVMSFDVIVHAGRARKTLHCGALSSVVLSGGILSSPIQSYRVLSSPIQSYPAAPVPGADRSLVNTETSESVEPTAMSIWCGWNASDEMGPMRWPRKPSW